MSLPDREAAQLLYVAEFGFDHGFYDEAIHFALNFRKEIVQFSRLPLRNLLNTIIIEVANPARYRESSR